MNILLIAPASGRWRSVGRSGLFKGRTFRFSLLSLLSVAAETPPGVNVRIVDEQVEEIPWADAFDLVGITCMTAAAPRAYEIVARFRERGVPVVLGGMHPTLCPDEAVQRADAIVVGEAEGVWPRVIADVVREIVALPGRFFVFIDDNLVVDRDYAHELFRALAPLKKRWITQATLSMADDLDLLAAAADAGCLGVFVGLETFSAANLGAVSKTCNQVARYREWIRRFHQYGIGIEAGIVFGFPGDRPAVFARTLRLLEELEVDVILVSIFTPLPGTPRFAAMKERLLDRNWAHYDFHHVVFEPWAMSAEPLQAGHDWITREFYRPWRIVRRVWRHLWRPRAWACLPYLAAVNLAFYGRTVRWHIRGWDPAREVRRPELPDRPLLARLAKWFHALKPSSPALR